jgi:Toluene-4-monooxygenase system protein B (TmoB)
MSETAIPIYGFVRGDMLGVLVLVRASDSVATLTAVLTEAAAVRVAPSPHARLFAGARELDPKSSVAAAGLSALDRVDLVPGVG